MAQYPSFKSTISPSSARIIPPPVAFPEETVKFPDKLTSLALKFPLSSRATIVLAVLRCVASDVTVNVVALEPLYVVLPESPVPAVSSVRVLGSLVVKSRAASTSSFVNAAATPVALNNSDWFVASLILNDGAVT